MAENLANLPLKCLQKEFPNKLNQSLTNNEEIGTPKGLHPAFYGCYDWHSSVHGHWMLVKLMKLFPNLKQTEDIKRSLRLNITKENIDVELEYFKRASEKSFERTYGWAWLLKLDEELITWDDPFAVEIHGHLQPLTEFIINKYLDFLPKLNYPVRSGEHPNTAFGLALAYDYAIAAKHDTLRHLIEQRSKDYYINDVACPLSWEPGGFDFLSPCFQEADLMARILVPADFKAWLNKFIPSIQKSDFDISEAKVSDRSDGKLVHLDGVNFCRAWSLYHIAQKVPEYGHLVALANKHIDASLPSVIDGGYEGEHWLATFAIYSLTSAPSQNK
ncbi:MAG: DUF2891 domain-containing protein [Saprospiraceae bacterium]